MRVLFPFLTLFIFITSCSSQSDSVETSIDTTSSIDAIQKLSAVETYYLEHHQDSIETNSVGSVSRGSLKNGTIIPFSGSNYSYFDTASYLSGRAFTHQLVAQTLVNTFKKIEENGETRKFKVMEFSNEHGGKMFPHRTHQNGLSVDMMMPLKKDEKPYYELDNSGAIHYLLDFNEHGQYTDDVSISIDFEQVANEILTLNEEAKKLGLKITKVIFNTDLKDELFSTSYGQTLKNSGPYITRNLEPVINDLHDDHFHIDFEIIN